MTYPGINLPGEILQMPSLAASQASQVCFLFFFCMDGPPGDPLSFAQLSFKSTENVSILFRTCLHACELCLDILQSRPQEGLDTTALADLAEQ